MGYLQRVAGDAMAEELHQQTWLSVLDNLQKFDPTTGAAAGGGFKAWLFRIATNKANDHWRSRGRERAAREGLRLVTDDELPPAGHRLEGTEQEQKLRRAIEQLPDAQRQVLMLRYYSNMKFVDIAHMLGCPLNTAAGTGAQGDDQVAAVDGRMRKRSLVICHWSLAGLGLTMSLRPHRSCKGDAPNGSRRRVTSDK